MPHTHRPAACGAPAAIAVGSDPPPAAACQRVWSLWRDRWRMCGGVPTQFSVVRIAPIVRTTTDLTSFVANAGVRAPTDLRVNEGLYLMPIGVEPKYDDPRTRRGGHFGYRTNGGNADPSASPAHAWAQWIALADALLTGGFEDPHRVALGCSLVRKPDGFSLKLWVADAAPREHARLRAAMLGLLRLRPGAVRYSPHSCILRNPGIRSTRSRHDSTSSRDSGSSTPKSNSNSSVCTPRRTPSPPTSIDTAWPDLQDEGMEKNWSESDEGTQLAEPLYHPPVFTSVYYPPYHVPYEQQVQLPWQPQQQQHQQNFYPLDSYSTYYYPSYPHTEYPQPYPTEAPVAPEVAQPMSEAFVASETPAYDQREDTDSPSQFAAGVCRFVLPRAFAPLRAVIRCVDDGFDPAAGVNQENDERVEGLKPRPQERHDEKFYSSPALAAVPRRRALSY